MRKTLISLALALLVLGGNCFSQTLGVKLVSSGEFKDKDGDIHAWKINGEHTLIWDAKPYIPVGGIFYSKYVCIDQTEENWKADVQVLELLKSKGITDILLKSVLPVTWTKPEAWQKLVGYLDASGFTYGIDLSDGPKAPLDGYIISPTRYRVGDIMRDTVLNFDMPDTIGGVWMLGRSKDGSIVSAGGASINNGKVTLNVRAPSGENCVLLFYPAKEFSNGSTHGVADLWGGFDEYRDRLVAFMSAMKFGKGLRFFVDPISSKMDLQGERASLIPDSAEFRLEFEAYLVKKYMNIGSLSSAWSIKADQLESFEQAARIIPLWYGPKGIPAIYDRARAKRFNVDTDQSRIWSDIISFRDASAQNYLNSAADILKRNAGNVPVIYKAESHHRVYANSVSRGGFDGLAVDSYGRGDQLVIDSAGPVYSLAEDSSRSMWLVVTGTQDFKGKEKPTPGYQNQESMAADLDSLAEIGAKGLFVDSIQVLPEESWKNHCLALFPNQLDWLKSFKEKFLDKDRANYAPRIIYFPTEPVVGAEIARIAPGVWWLPSLRSGSGIYFGDTIGAYIISGQDGICLWSRSGQSTATFLIGSTDKPVVTFPSDTGGVMTLDKKKAVLKLGETPIILTGLDPQQVFPSETVEDVISKLQPLITRAKAASITVDASEEALKTSQEMLKNGASSRAFDKAHAFVEQLTAAVGSYTWLEGESAVSNFDGVASAVETSAGGYLKLDTAVKPTVTPYTASFMLYATKDANHEIWVAATAPENGASPISFSIDNTGWQQAMSSPPVSRYGRDFAWYKIGYANLSTGTHTLQIRADNPGSMGSFKLGIDAIVLSPIEFKPNGVKKP